MKILIVSQYFWPENFKLNDLAYELSERGHEIFVITGYPNYPGGKIYRDFKTNPKRFNCVKKINIIRVPIIPRGNSKLTLLLNYLSFVISSCIFGVIKLRSFTFDKILVYQVSPITVGLPAILFSKITKAPIYFWVLDQWPETLVSMGVIKSKMSLYVFSLLSKYIYKNCAVILGQTESFLENIEKYGVPKNKLRCLPNWAEDIFLKTDEVKPAKEIRKKKDDFLVLFAGNVGEAQGFDAVIKAASITEKYKNIKWVIVGKGRDWDRVKQKIDRLNLSSVEMLGQFPLSRMHEFYAAADALLVCLKSDPLFSITVPGKLQSYLMSKKPVLGMRNGEGAMLIKKAHAGICCAAEDSEGLANNALKMSKLSKRELDIMGKNGRDYCIKNFDRKEVIDCFESLISEQ